MSLKLLIFCLLKIASVGFDKSLEFVDCGLDGSVLRVPIEYGVCCTLDGVFSCDCGAVLILDDDVL